MGIHWLFQRLFDVYTMFRSRLYVFFLARNHVWIMVKMASCQSYISSLYKFLYIYI